MTLPGVHLCGLGHPDLRVSCGLPRDHDGAHGTSDGEVWWRDPVPARPVTHTPPRYDEVYREGVAWLDTL